MMPMAWMATIEGSGIGTAPSVPPGSSVSARPASPSAEGGKGSASALGARRQPTTSTWSTALAATKSPRRRGGWRRRMLDIERPAVPPYSRAVYGTASHFVITKSTRSFRARAASSLPGASGRVLP